METETNNKNKRDPETQRVMNVLKLVGWAFIIIIGLIFLFGSFYIIGAGERGVIVTLGNPSDAIITEGLHFKFPMIQKIIKFDIKTQKDEVEATAASKDLQTVQTKVAVNYHLDSSSAPRIYQEIGVDYVSRIISPAIQETVKASTAQFTAEELITKREEVREKIRILLYEKVFGRGIIVEDILITNFDFSESFNAAIENKVTNEQNALAAKNKLEQVKYEADQRIAAANGEAEAIRIQSQAIQSQGGKEYVQLQAISRWNGIMPLVVGSGSMPFININGIGGNATI